MKIHTLNVSLAVDYHTGKKSLLEVARELCQAGWSNFVDLAKAKKVVEISLFEFYWCDGTGERDRETGRTEVMTGNEVLWTILGGLYGLDPRSARSKYQDCATEDRQTIEAYIQAAEVGQVLDDGDFNVKRIA